MLPPRGGVAPPTPAPSPAAARPRSPLLPPPRRRPPLLPRGGPVPGDGPLRAVPAPGARSPAPSARPLPLGATPLRAAPSSRRRGPAPCARRPGPRLRGSLALSRAAPRPPVCGHPGPGARPLPSAAWTPTRLAWPRRGLALPRLPQRVPACAAPRTR
jgi:hypothetical protein